MGLETAVVKGEKTSGGMTEYNVKWIDGWHITEVAGRVVRRGEKKEK